MSDALTANLQREQEIRKAYPYMDADAMLIELVVAKGVSVALCGVQAVKEIYDTTYAMAVVFEYGDHKRRQEDAEERRNREAQEARLVAGGCRTILPRNPDLLDQIDR